MVRRRLRRDWTSARAKVTEERVCRLHRDGRCKGVVEAAHVVGRENDEVLWQSESEKRLIVSPDSIVPLCRFHHRGYDEHCIDVLAVLTRAEQERAVRDAGGIALAYKRTAPLAYRALNEGRAA